MSRDVEEPSIAVVVAAPGVLVATINARELGEFETALADDLRALVLRADRDPEVRAVVLTGSHPGRFVSHASIPWLQEGGRDAPTVTPRSAGIFGRLGRAVNRTRALEPLLRKTPLSGILELDRLHDTFVRMNRSGVIYVGALNGSALGVGAELSWACDLRLMADGPYFIGQPEILLGFNPGGGGTQRLTRLVGTHRSLKAILEGKPFPAAEALELGAVDELVASDKLLEHAVEAGRRLGSRSKPAIAAVKRSVYFGGSQSLTEGLHTERSEFLSVLGAPDAQQRMLAYIDRTAADGELPLYVPELYAAALETGRIPEGSGSPG